MVRNYFTLIVLFIFFSYNGFSQCPSSVQSTTQCAILTYISTPSPLPSSIIIGNKTYNYESGTGTGPYRFNNNNGNCTPDPFTGTLTIGGTSCTYNAGALPISLSNFAVSVVDDMVAIDFSTSSETNNDYFTIEKSTDGTQYDAVTMINGAGNSVAEIHYSYADHSPSPGVSYYRIKQTDFDGHYTYSEVKSVRINTLHNVVIKPTSTNRSVHIQTDLEQYSLSVYSTSGQEMQSYISLSNDQTIDVTDLLPGIYYVRVSSGIASQNTKIIKF